MDLQIIIAIASYFSIILVIGYCALRHSRKTSDFILGKRSINYWVTAISVHASDMSGWLFMGYPALVYSRGLIEGWTAIGLLGGMFLTWQYVAHKLRTETERYDCATLSSYFEQRFSDVSGLIRIISALFSLVFFTFYISSGIVELGRLFESLLGINYHLGITIGILVVFYTLLGGFVSMAWVDFFQGLFLLTMLLVVPIVALCKIGGFSSVIQAAHAQQVPLSLLPDFSCKTLLDIIFTSMGWGLGYFGLPHVLTKFMGIDDASKLKRAQYIGITWQILVLSAATIVGLVGIAYFSQGLERPELIFVSMVKDLFPPFIAGFILCAILAAAINVIGAQILASASIVTEDFFKKLTGNRHSHNTIQWFSRASILVLCFLAYCSAYTTTQTIYKLVQYAWSGLGCTFGPILLVALHSKVTNHYVGLAGILAGGLTGVFWSQINTTVPSMIAGYIASFAAMGIAHIITSKTKKGVS